MNAADVRRLVARLDLPSGDWALHGSAPLLLHGLVDEVGDVDVLARGDAWRRARHLGPVRAGTRDRVVEPFAGVEIFDGWLGDDVDALVDAATPVDGIPCVPLRAILTFKRRLGRPKDLDHVRILERHLGLER